MIEVLKLRVYSLSKDHLDLIWETGNSSIDPHDFTFVVERSESQYGPFDQISEPFSDKYEFRDIIVNLFHRWRQYWYRIRITRKSDSNITYSESARLEAQPDLVVQEVRRQELILFREHIGRKCWLFPVRTFGQRCSCYDHKTRQRIRSGCLTCFDTTFVTGYLNPIEAYVQFDPSPDHTEFEQLHETQQQNTSARMPYFPTAKPRDIIVESENRRWRVERVSTTKRLRAVVHQELVVHEVPGSDIEYRLPIRISDLANFEASPEREFTNPQDLENTDDANWFTLMLKGHGYRG
jgi:hypothetical protein